MGVQARLRAAEEPTAQAGEAREEAPAGPILLVEHYRPLAKPLLRGLEDEGVVAHLARTDGEAQERALSCPYAAVVVNWSVPRQGGVELVRSWRAAGVATPALLLVPSAEEPYVLEGLDAGADDFLPLPFSFRELLARLRTWTRPLRASPAFAARLSHAFLTASGIENQQRAAVIGPVRAPWG
jgi:two-component system OmpR family response regulator